MKLIKMSVTQDIIWVVEMKKYYNCHDTTADRTFQNHDYLTPI